MIIKIKKILNPTGSELVVQVTSGSVDNLLRGKLRRSYLDCELCPPEGDGGLDEPGGLRDCLGDLGRGGRDQLGLAVLDDGSEARLGKVWRKNL